MRDYLAKLQAQYTEQFVRAASEYFDTGLGLLHRHRAASDSTSPQAAIGNLAVAVELILKAFIASKHLVLLFKGLPLEVRTLLLCSVCLPEDFSLRALDIDLKSATYTTLEFDECIAVFYLFFPELKQQLQSHLRFMSKARNASLHSFLPSFQKYELDRAAYATLRVFDALKTTKGLTYLGQRWSERDSEFMAEFQESRLERVQKAIEAAKEHARKLTGKPSSIAAISNHWETQITTCPICGSDAVLIGFTQRFKSEPNREGQIPLPSLAFFPDSFQCAECGLTLADYDELKLAGIPTDFYRYDRSGEIERFIEEYRSGEMYASKNTE